MSNNISEPSITGTNGLEQTRPSLTPILTTPPVVASELIISTTDSTISSVLVNTPSSVLVNTPSSTPIYPDYCKINDIYLGKTITDSNNNLFRSYTKRSCDLLGGTWNNSGECKTRSFSFSVDCSAAPPAEPPPGYHIIETPSTSLYESDKCASSTSLVNEVCTKVNFKYPCPITTKFQIINEKPYCILQPNEDRMENDTNCGTGVRHRHICFKPNPIVPINNPPPCPTDTIKIDNFCRVHSGTKCQDGTVYDSNSQTCIGVPKCGPNTYLNPDTNRCYAEVL